MHKRLFIAIKINPTEELLRRIYFLKSNLKHELINWIREDHYHLTLKFLGKVDIKRIDEISNAIKKSVISVEKQELCVGDLGVFGSKYQPRVLWLSVSNNDKILLLHKEIVSALHPFGFFNDGQNFVPHISIARIKKIDDKTFFQNLLNKSAKDFINKQNIDEVILYESILGNKGAEYKVIERFELGNKEMQ